MERVNFAFLLAKKANGFHVARFSLNHFFFSGDKCQDIAEKLHFISIVSYPRVKNTSVQKSNFNRDFNEVRVRNGKKGYTVSALQFRCRNIGLPAKELVLSGLIISLAFSFVPNIFVEMLSDRLLN